ARRGHRADPRPLGPERPHRRPRLRPGLRGGHPRRPLPAAGRDRPPSPAGAPRPHPGRALAVTGLGVFAARRTAGRTATTLRYITCSAAPARRTARARTTPSDRARG